MYHRIAPCPRGSLVPGHYVSPKAFARQISALNKLKFEVIGMQEVVDQLQNNTQSTHVQVAITFDDGYENFFTSALPILKEQKLPATVFIVSDLLGATNEWDESRGDVRERLMTAEQTREASQQGITIGSHTTRHQHLTQIPAHNARESIERSKSDIEKLTGKPVDFFCFPYGEFNPEVRNLVEQAGYKAAVSTRKAANIPGADLFALNRVNIRRDTSLPIFLMKLFRATRMQG